MDVPVFKRWRRLDEPGLEVLRITREGSGWLASSCLAFGGEPSFGLRYDWRLDADWRTRSLQLEIMSEVDRTLSVERTGTTTWRVNGEHRAELDGCDELDVSATPFCNALAIRRLQESAGEITALYIPVPDLALTPSRQRYERRGDKWRYIDLGAVKGFEADLELDRDGFVRRYEGLFEAV